MQLDGAAAVAVVGAANTNSNDGANKKNINNPFERLQPPLRSEEDEIRKGIFARALRLLHTATDEVKLRWRHAIEEAAAARQYRTCRHKKPALVAEEFCEPTPLVASAAVKRPRDDAKEGAVEAENGKGTKNADEGESGELRPVAETGTEHSGPHTGAEVSEVDNTEFIAAYLRTLLDKVVGLSLLELHVEALRVLCVMLDIPLPKSRSKMALYSTLASFHYTHCEKLGKRVSSSHIVQAQLKRDEQMIQKLLSRGSTSQATSAAGRSRAVGAATTAATPPGPTGATNTAVLSSNTSRGNHRKNTRTMLTAVDGNVSSMDDTPRIPRRTSASDTAAKVRTKTPMEGEEGAPAEVEGEAELEVRHNDKVFAAAAVVHQAVAASRLNNSNEEDEEDEEWTMMQLEKKVASVVQLYDPVTSVVVVKKLAQMGYRKPSAMETVEAILRSFHQRELVFYDNGIAYLL
ncbi:uncharacterized protein Tco025E_05096 [Trypanosoma conorhini]|uniref:Uncharacterized protein n=1 Tax=Trypanosoma conorhini TaxID=83891 RepID=A0A422PG88_9TRYP|nr:uncharacterized protein Tco025E_05096 [Trypanosoma conorhini]RNF16717.1 hypothetical protein Tco025E_05096 [Trypanosoma conorhini]